VMAEANVCGRIHEQRDRFLETIEFFREFCQEHHCLDTAYPFASAHSRFIYFHKEDADPTYTAFDDTRMEVILMCGLPGTGKDYWIDLNHPDLAVVSLDRLRIEMGILPTDEQGEIIQAGRDLAKGYLQSETPFIWNATNIVKPIRSGLIRLFAGYSARLRIVYLEVPIDRVLRQNRNRQAQVPHDVIYRYRDRLEIPDLTEVHQVDYFADV
jgi:predicted kinase